MLSRLELIPRSRFPAFLTGSVAEETSIAAQQSRERVSAIVRTFDHCEKHNRPPVCLRRAIAQNLANFESLSGDNEATNVNLGGFRVPQHQKRVLVKNLLR